MIKINKRIGWRLIGEEIVAFNCDNHQIVTWNNVASQLWEKLMAGGNFDSLIDWLIKEYSLGRKNAIEDVKNFLQEASSMGFLNFEESKNQSEPDASTGENVLLAIELEAIKNLIPLDITFESTYSCNEQCIHCFMERGLPSLRLSSMKRILNEVAAAGCLFISFTGGEFFTRSDALEIIEFAGSLHFVIDILSNGVLINERVVELLLKHPVRRVQVSLYGTTYEIHDSITRLRGSFHKTINAVKLLRRAGIKVEIAFPMMSINFHQRHTARQLAESLDCLISPSHMITARNNGSTDTFSLRLSDEQLREFLSDKKLFDLYAGRKPFKGHQFYLGLKDMMTAPPCYSGFNSCAITPSGKVLPCNQFLYAVGDLEKRSFLEIWHNSPKLKFIRSLTLRDLTQCSGCELLFSCARCPGLAHLEGGNIFGPSPENCRITKISNQI